MFSVIRDVRQKNNPDLKYRILITLLDLRLRDHINMLNQLKKYLGESLYKTLISIDTNFRKSHINGVPINHLAPTSRGALQYRELAQEIIKDLEGESMDLQEQTVAGKSTEINKFDLNPITPAAINPTPRDAHDTYPNNTSRTAPTKFSQDERQSGRGAFCSYLGRDEDPHTMLAYPSIWNKCHHAKPIVSPSLNHQNIFCLSNNHFSCPLLQGKTRGNLPAQLRAPMDKSELLRYFTNWIKAKIS